MYAHMKLVYVGRTFVRDREEYDMKKKIAIVLVMICMLALVGCGSSKLVEGSEKTYYGTVTDRAMSVVNEGDREGRPYITISTDDNTEICFWFVKDCESNAKIGDVVTIESAIEEQTDLLVAISVTVNE